MVVNSNLSKCERYKLQNCINFHYTCPGTRKYKFLLVLNEIGQQAFYFHNHAIIRLLAYCTDTTLIFISGRGSGIPSAKQGKSGSIYLVKNKQVVWASQMCVHFMKILTAYTLNSNLLALKAHIHKKYFFVVH